MSFTWAWGSQPAQGAITFVSSGAYPAITYGAWIEIDAFGKTFYGVCQQGPVIVSDGVNSTVIPTERSSSGSTMRLDFQDPRLYLRYDVLFCCFNILDIRVINGIRVRRYKHMLPKNYKRHTWTYTTNPLSAAVIIQQILLFNTANYGANGTVGTIWTASSIWPNGTYHPGAYHPVQINNPVYNIDAMSGRHLDELLQEISDSQGLLFTLQGGPFNLVWCRKGDGVQPSFPERSDNQSLSKALSENPTRIFVVGDRNRYLCLDLVLQPDWNTNWQEFLTIDGLMQWLYDNATDHTSGERYNAITDDTEHPRGYQLAAARAREITVREIMALRGATWADYRFFGGRSRMDMSAALYLATILFRAFRPPDYVKLKGESVPTSVLELTDDLFARVSLDTPSNPKMQVDLDNPPAGNGYAIVKGWNIGDEIFKAIKPERFNLNDFTIANNLWRQVTFQIDESFETGKYLIFDEPMINPVDLFIDQTIDQTIAGQALNGYMVLKANPTITPPEVRAALVFEGDRFIYPYSTGVTSTINPTRDDKLNESGLFQEVVQYSDGSWAEMPYADGGYASTKAIELASVLCQRPYWYYQGDYEWKLLPGDIIPDLTGMINRITIEHSPSGHVCAIEFANGQPEPVYRREREYDRRRQLLNMLPGQQELRDEARLLKQLATAFRQSPQLARKMEEFFRTRMGQISTGQLEPVIFE